MRPRALRRSPVTMAGGCVAGLGGGASDAASFFAAGLGAALFQAAGFFFGSGARRLGPASSSSSEMGDNCTPVVSSASPMLLNVRRK